VLKLQKAWVEGAQADTADLSLDGVSDDSDTSTASGGDETDTTNTAVITVLPDETVTLSEVLGAGNTGDYTTGFGCTGNSNPPTYTPGATSATLLIDAADTSITCTYTNTLETAALKLQKTWAGAIAADTADLSLDGFNDDNDTSTATGGNETDTTNTADIVALVGETVTLSEVLGAGNTGDYIAGLSCTGNTNPPSYTPGATSATLLIDAADTSITCTFSNTLDTAALKLQKSWANGLAADTADLVLNGFDDDSDTSTATGGNETDTTNTADITALVGETVTLSEVLGAGNTGEYIAGFGCTGNANPPGYTPGDTSATLLIDAADTSITCSFANTLDTTAVKLQKAWVDGVAADTADLNLEGLNDDNDTSTASGGDETDKANTADAIVLVGETVTLSEVLGAGNTGDYTTNFSCTGNTNPPTYTPGNTSATLLIDAADTSLIICTYTNTLKTAALKLQKAWVGGVAADTVDLNLDGFNDDDNDTSTATGGDETDTLNTADIKALVGETVTLSEVLGGGNTGDYTAGFGCDSINAPTYTPGDTSATLLIDAADTAITCTFTNTLDTTALKLQKAWVGGVAADIVDLNLDGFNDDDNDTSTATGGDETDSINTADITALVGETVTLSEVPGAGNTGNYTAGISCDSINAPTYTPGDTSATLLIDPADTSITCTYTNTLDTVPLRLQKRWVDGTAADTADLSLDGFNDDSDSSTATGGDETDSINTADITALVGETVALSEVLGAGNTGEYIADLSCDGINLPGYIPGSTSGTLLIDEADTPITCTFSNMLDTATLKLQKAWANGVAADTADLSLDGFNDDNDTSTAAGGNETDTTNTADTTVLVGETVTLSEVLGAGNTGDYTTSFSCSGANAPTYTPGDTRRC
jgi:hypothetical protein